MIKNIRLDTKDKLIKYGVNKNVVGEGLVSPQLSKMRKIIDDELIKLQDRFSKLRIDKHAIMPNHICLIFELGCAETSSAPYENQNNTKSYKETGVCK